MKKLIIACSIMAVFIFAEDAGAQAIAQEIKFASSPNPVGSGGRAIAWGGAFIAIADDATAASWNPAGLIQLETPEASVVLSYQSRNESAEFDEFESDSDSLNNHGELNYASAALPFTFLDHNFVASINYQRLYEFNRFIELDLEGTREFEVIGIERYEENAEFEQMGALTTVSPAIAAQVTPEFSIGLTLNFWGLDQEADGWENELEIEHESYFPDIDAHQYVWAYQKEKYTLTGFNANLGILWTPGRFTIGAVYKFGFEGDLDYETEFESAQFSPDEPFLTSNVFKLEMDYDEKITWPASYGIGVGYRYSDALSFAVDLYTREWSNFKVEDEEGNEYNLIGGRVEEEDTDVENTIQVRAGCEYLRIMQKIALAIRGGAYYDPAPGDDTNNVYYGVSLGTGIVYKNFVTDIAYQYRWATDVESEEILGERGEADVSEHFLIASLIYHF